MQAATQMADEPAAELAHGAMRGAIGAMAMTGMPALTVDLGVAEQTPPRAILRRRASGLLRRDPRNRRRAAKRPRPVERLAFAMDHLLYGLVLSGMRRRPRD